MTQTRSRPFLSRARRLLLAGIVALAAGGAAAAVVLDALCPPDLSRLAPTWTVTDRHGRVLRAFLSPDETWRLPTTAAEVDPLYLRMLLAFEDRRFGWHPGVDPLAVLRATGQAMAHGRVVSGASTLTMQAARLLEPRPRTLPSKLIEMARALQLTAHLGRDGVLDAYLTLAPFGGNLEGVRAATWAWWGKEPRRLTPGQAALLVALPQTPNRLRPDRHPEAARAARAKVLARMVDAGVLTADQAREAAAEPLPATRRPLPVLAPHLTGRLVRAAAPDAGPVLATTLDATLQARVEALVRVHAARLDDARLSVAALVVESETGAARAWVGSPGLLETARQGAVDMTRAPRSPGSALKPLIYGMAFEDGVLHPRTEIDDRPTRFGGGYTPGNFGFAHHGEVTAAEALRRSLNVPAVAVLDRVGPMRFAARLRAAGVEPRRRGGLGRPGLPLALGGLGVTLEEMVGLYATLASGGQRRAVRAVEPPSPTPAPVRILSATAAWQVVEILAQAPPATGFAPDSATRDGRAVAFKTGTSYGFRDAWALGMDGDHVVGVWVGRADGTPVPGRIGRDTAAPLMRRLFDLLPPPARPVPGPPPPGILQAPRTANLPPPLRRLRPVGAGPAAASGRDGLPPLILRFPPDRATMDWAQAGQGLTLEASGGRRPYAWLVNGRPLPSLPWHRGAQWTPDGRGAARVTVIDAEGRAETVDIWLK
ncbi:penicillin-binding protein 1C [Roseospira visakhapatnamensis]|uniref:peptidoglycan glycosyltransferase n=1 Tax=Roseospira visakhapatnamensis TaxID=390880 RepID=A0A7W6W9B9_9PROT|nr:penicillin-binding protein 1C [Roseospira visakhapatnamensis]MBB4265714.1 penicillin-binding protein 1C [Roseospira visakhapatnamensis]